MFNPQVKFLGAAVAGSERVQGLKGVLFVCFSLLHRDCLVFSRNLSVYTPPSSECLCQFPCVARLLTFNQMNAQEKEEIFPWRSSVPSCLQAIKANETPKRAQKGLRAREHSAPCWLAWGAA